MKKFLAIFVVSIVLILALSACGENGGINTPQLSTPTNIYYDGPTLKWDAVENADAYVLTVFTNSSSYTISVTNTYYDITVSSAGDYIATVKARRSDGAYKDSEPSAAVIYHMGAGTEADPVMIYSKTELAAIGIGATITTVNAETTTTPKYYKLVRDIDLAGAEWTPIGSGDNRFQGHFDGQNHTVSNFKITKVDTSTGSFIGLFKGVLNGSISNLTISEYVIDIGTDGAYRIGGLAGNVQGAEITNCHAVNGSISLDVADSNTEYLGQLIGYANYYTDPDTAAQIRTVITDCSASGTIEADTKTTGNTVYAGGLIGYLYGSDIRYSYSSGTVEATGKTLYLGGFAGGIRYLGASAENCYTNAAVSGITPTLCYAGSFAGFLSSDFKLKYCYATGSADISADATTKEKGFLGHYSGTSSYTACYYDYETAGLANPSDSGNTAELSNIYAITTAEMLTAETYLGWDLTDVWAIDGAVNGGYPTLKSDRVVALAAPTGLVFSGFKLNWTTVTGASGYLVTVTVGEDSYTINTDTNSATLTISGEGDYSAVVRALSTTEGYRDSADSAASVYTMASGTEADPIAIGTLLELNAIGTGAETSGKYYELTANIDCGGAAITPIGGGAGFSGYFDGNDFAITNFILTATNASGYYGLFGAINGGRVENLDVEDYIFTIADSSTIYVGGLAGYVRGAVINNVNLIGGAITMTAASGNKFAGQLIGYLGALSGTPSAVTSCSADGSITLTAGLTGNTVYAGGLFGSVVSSEVTKCYSKGTLALTAKSIYAGGLSGSISGSGAVISNSYSLAGISAISGNLIYAGSFAGYAANGLSVTNCYAKGAVSKSADAATGSAGFIGYYNNAVPGTFTSLLYDSETTGLGANADSGNTADIEGIISADTAAMKSSPTYSGWNFTTVWAIGATVNNGYPTLR